MKRSFLLSLTLSSLIIISTPALTWAKPGGRGKPAVNICIDECITEYSDCFNKLRDLKRFCQKKCRGLGNPKFNQFTCIPWVAPVFIDKNDCNESEYCDFCATSSCPMCDDCIAACVPSCDIFCIVPDPVCGIDGNTYYCGVADAACHGVEVAYPGECSSVFCGGIAGIQCPKGMVCIDDPRDNCNPNSGGADCGGICVEPVCGDSREGYLDLTNPDAVPNHANKKVKLTWYIGH